MKACACDRTEIGWVIFTAYVLNSEWDIRVLILLLVRIDEEEYTSLKRTAL